MNVSFNASGAINKAHYELVQAVETASDPGLADGRIFHAIDDIRARFAKASFASNSDQCRDWLLVLMYCETALTSPPRKPDEFDFALPAAVGLAEGGKTVSCRRIGYQYCILHLRSTDDLQLMLINTYRKDLESHQDAQVCLALEMLVQKSTSDVIPAISERLEILLSHRSRAVRRRTLAAFKALSQHDTELLNRARHKIYKRLQDEPLSSATTLLAVEMAQAEIIAAPELASFVVALLKRSASHPERSRSVNQAAIISALGRLLELIIPTEYIIEHAEFLLSMLRSPSTPVELLEIVRAISRIPVGTLMEPFQRQKRHPVKVLKALLRSEDRNQQYAALACLLSLDPRLWAGTDDAIPPQLEESDVHRIMSLLESNDSTLRVMTGRLLTRIDPGIMQQYLERFIEGIPSPELHSLAVCESYALRALELIPLVDQMGDTYAEKLFRALEIVQRPRKSPSVSGLKDPIHRQAARDAGWGGGTTAVLEPVVENVLSYMRSSNDEFYNSVSQYCSKLLASHESLVPTSVVLCAAILCEFGASTSLPFEDACRNLGKLLSSSSVGVQEVLLVAMLKLAALCDSSLDDLVQKVSLMAHGGGRHMRRRYDQFVSLASDPPTLKDVVKSARSSSLPDVLTAIERYWAQFVRSRAQGTGIESHSPKHPPSTKSSKLRYKAYDPPTVSSRPSRPRTESSGRSKSARSDFSERSPTLSAADSDPLATTFSPGLLALSVGDEGLRASISAAGAVPPLRTLDSVAARVDLISLESPFHAELPSLGSSTSTSPASPVNFKEETFNQRFLRAWKGLNKETRGWCEPSAMTMAQRLHAADLGIVLSVGNGDLSIGKPSEEVLGLFLTRDGTVPAAVKLRPGDDDSCLWILKCDDFDTRKAIRDLLQNDP